MRRWSPSRMLAFATLSAAAVTISEVGASPARADDKPAESNALTVTWKDGLRIESGDKKSLFRVGGRIQSDWGFFSEDDELAAEVGAIEDGTEMRRVRLNASGLIDGVVDFKNEIEFAGGRVQLRDVHIALVGLPGIGMLKVGHTKEPFSLEEMASDSHVPFQERALVQAFVPSRNTGIMMHNAYAQKRLTFAAGVFREVDGSGNTTGDGEHNVTARITGLPIWDEETGTLIHVGAAASVRSPVDDAARFRARPEANLAPYFVDTGDGALAAESVTLLAGEFAAARGPAAVQAEFIGASVGSPGMEDPTFTSYYVQGTWCLTGERVAYRAGEGTFGGVKPSRPFSTEGGAGAWQLAARLSRIDLNDAAIAGGELTDVTLGINWWLNTLARLTANVVLSDLADAGNATAFLTRLQLDF